MPYIDPARIRNIGIMAHIDAGKTTLSERILFYTQRIHRMGEVHDGAATMDFMPEEQERGITIASACSTCRWDDISINLIDTPGHVDFTMEVERCLRVLDGAVAVFCAVGGVEPQSETVWRQSEAFHVPKLAFINKMDRIGADFDAVLRAMRDRLGANPAPLFVPIGAGPEFAGLIDIINGGKIIFDEKDQGRTMSRLPLADSEEDLLRFWRDRLPEIVAEADDEFMEKWLEEKWDEKDLQAAMRRATIACRLTPCVAGAALRNIGVQPLLDAVRDFLPSPLDAPPAAGEKVNGGTMAVRPDPGGEPIALVFKIVMEGSRKNAFIRLYSGTLEEGGSLLNTRAGKSERAGRIYRVQADRREALAELGPGDIAAITGFREARTGDTYSLKSDPVVLEPIRAYTPVITLALEPLNADEGKLLDEALEKYTEEDPTLRARIDEESGLRELSGMGELHLDVILERIAREYGIRPRAGKPKAVMRETIMNKGAASIKFDRELGKERHVGEVSVLVEPRKRGAGNLVDDYLPPDGPEARKILPAAWREAAREGVDNALSTGVSAGWPVTDIHVHISDIGAGADSTLPGIKMAAAHAAREAMQKASPTLLEPIMEVEITCPEEFLGAAINLFNQTGGHIEDIRDQAGSKQISGSAPLRRLFGFSTPLRSATQGRAAFAATFRNFDLGNS